MEDLSYRGKLPRTERFCAAGFRLVINSWHRERETKRAQLESYERINYYAESLVPIIMSLLLKGQSSFLITTLLATLVEHV